MAVNPFSYEMVWDLANDPMTPPDVLHTMSQEAGNISLLLAIADNPTTSPKALDIALLMAIAANHSTSPETLASMVHADSSRSLLIQVAQNPNTPVEAVATLATSPHNAVRENVIFHPCLGVWVSVTLAFEVLTMRLF